MSLPQELLPPLLYDTAGLPQLSNLPVEILSDIFSQVSQNDLVSISCVNRKFHRLVLPRLYSTIVIVNDEAVGYFNGSRPEANKKSPSTRHFSSTVMKVSSLNKFASTLTVDNFKQIIKIVIQAQSTLIAYDYFPLYQKLYNLWDLVPNHPILFLNYDINNLRNFQSFNQYIYNSSSHFIEDACVNLPQNLKINNLKSWTVFNFDELFQLPHNNNLINLNVFIENNSWSNMTHSPSLSIMNNLSNLEGLYLNTPIATSKVLSYLNNCKVTNPDFQLKNLRRLSITSSHSYKDNSLLTFELLNNIIDLQRLKKLEFKINCIHHDCHCIIDLFHQLDFNYSNLEHFILINYKSNNLKQNLNQFNMLLQSPHFFKMLTPIKSLYLNVNDFIKLDTSDSSKNKFSIAKLLNNLTSLPELKDVTIPDFFNNWLFNLPMAFPSLPEPLDGNEDSQRYFDLLLNRCSCLSCHRTRTRYNRLANFDSQNNYKHEFKKSSANLSSHSLVSLSTSRVEFTNTNINFLNYLISNLKKQFIYVNENLMTINSVINSSKKPFIVNEDLIEFNNLFLHNALKPTIDQIKAKNPHLSLVNFGGIVVEYDDNNNFKFPYAN